MRSKIFVLDDDEQLALLIRKNLEREGLSVTVSSDEKKAVSFILKDTPDLVLLDYQLRQTTGKEFIGQLNRAGKTIPFIIMTGHGDERIAVEMMKLGARDYLTKDIHFLDMLPSVIHKTLGVLRTEKELNDVQRALQESEEKFREMAEHIHEVFWLFDWLNRRIIYVSPAYEKIWGRKVEDLYNRHEEWTESVYPDDFPRTQTFFKKIVQADGGESREYRIIRTDGQIRWICDRGFPVKDASGQIVRIAGIAEDITRRKKQEERLRLALDAANDGLYDWNIKTGEVYFSPRYYTMLGFEPYEMPPGFEMWKMLLHPDDSRPALELLKEIIENQDNYETEFRLKTKDGSWKWILSRGKVSDRDELGRAVRIAGTHVDITERKKLESQLQQSHKMKAIGTLAGGIAHDFNNILGIILGHTELALDTVQEWNPARQNLKEVIKASLRARDVVRQLLSVSRKSEDIKKTVNPGTVITESLKLMRSSLPANIEIRQNIPEDIHTIAADPTQLHQVMINVCTNSAQAMEENGGRIEVNVKNVELDLADVFHYPDLSPGPYVSISVSDTGHGVPSDIIGQIFDPYFTTREFGKGSGMGLAVVHGIVKNSKGAISVYSEPGKGAAFKIVFPAIPQHTGAEAETIEPFPTGTERILFVDDETDLVNIGKQLLDRLGYETVVRTNPVEALNLFTSDPDRFDLVLTDMTMPQMSGEKLIREIRAVRPDMPVILCTGFSEKINEERARQMGVDKYFEKPLNKREIARTIRQILDGKRQCPPEI
jgi:PAS domain S-box-containing protein